MTTNRWRCWLFALMMSARPLLAQPKNSAEQRTARHFDSIRQQALDFCSPSCARCRKAATCTSTCPARFTPRVLSTSPPRTAFASTARLRPDRASLRRCLRPLRQQAGHPPAPTRTTFSTTPSSMPGPCATGRGEEPGHDHFFATFDKFLPAHDQPHRRCHRRSRVTRRRRPSAISRTHAHRRRTCRPRSSGSQNRMGR